MSYNMTFSHLSMKESVSILTQTMRMVCHPYLIGREDLSAQGNEVPPQCVFHEHAISRHVQDPTTQSDNGIDSPQVRKDSGSDSP